MCEVAAVRRGLSDGSVLPRDRDCTDHRGANRTDATDEASAVEHFLVRISRVQLLIPIRLTVNALDQDGAMPLFA
jgi:hypothetical protein